MMPPNVQRLSLRKLLKRHPKINQALDRRFPWPTRQRDYLVANKTFNQYRETVNEILRATNLSHNNEVEGLTINERYNYLPDSEIFISVFRCAKSHDKSIACSLLSRIDSIQDRRCVTLLHQAALNHDQLNRPDLFEMKQDSQIETNQFYFASHDVIKLLIDFEPEDYGDTKRQIGARLAIHPSDYVASANDCEFYVGPGNRYDITLRREDIIATKGCYQYDGRNYSDQLKESINPRLVLSAESCIQNCIVRRVIHWTKCWPTTMPYFRNDSFDPDLSLEPCGWYREAQYFLLHSWKPEQEGEGNLTNILSGFGAKLNEYNLTTQKLPIASQFSTEMQIYRNIQRLCVSKCPQPCNSNEYSISLSKSVWPTDIKVRLDKSGRGWQTILRHCCALVNIKFINFHYSKLIFKPKYTFSDVVGNLGALLAVWLGLSMVSVYHAIQKFVDFCHGPARQTTVVDKTTNELTGLPRSWRLTSELAITGGSDDISSGGSSGYNSFRRKRRLLARLNQIDIDATSASQASGSISSGESLASNG